MQKGFFRRSSFLCDNETLTVLVFLTLESIFICFTTSMSNLKIVRLGEFESRYVVLFGHSVILSNTVMDVLTQPPL